MPTSLEETRFSGELLVVIHGVGDFTPNLTDETLFTYVGHSFACLVTGFGPGQPLVVHTGPSDWKIVAFDPIEQVIVVESITPIEQIVQRSFFGY